MKMKNMLGETGGKAIIIKVAKSLDELCSCPSILWKVEVVSGENGYLTEEISKQSVQGVTLL